MLLVMYDKVELVESSGAPKIVASISIDKNMHVKLFKNTAPIPLSAWFRYGANCALKSTHLFYKQPHFPVEPRAAIGSAQNEAQNCYEVANVFWRL